MIYRRFLSLAALIAILSVGLLDGSARGQEKAGEKHVGQGIDRVQLFDSLEPNSGASNSGATTPESLRKARSVAELRQARAIYRANQRVARLERNLWMGYEPLRPNWSSTPMTSSRYAPRRIYVPVYIRSR